MIVDNFIYNEGFKFDFDGNNAFTDYEINIEDFDALVEEMDFSLFTGTDTKKNLNIVNKNINTKLAKNKSKKINKPINRSLRASQKEKKIGSIIIPEDKTIIIEGLNKFILNPSDKDAKLKNIGYYKGKKLKELMLIINNETPNNFNIELFNPSSPLDYLYSTSQNLNNQISVANSPISYSDVLFNILANPVLIPNAKMVITGLNATQQKNETLILKNKSITGEQFIQPVNVNLQIDPYQFQKEIVAFHIEDVIGRNFLPDGMNVIQYTVLPFTQVAVCFYYEQMSLAKDFYQTEYRPVNIKLAIE